MIGVGVFNKIRILAKVGLIAVVASTYGRLEHFIHVLAR
jgi:hypothetical protein